MTLADGTEAFVGQRVTRSPAARVDEYASKLESGEIVAIGVWYVTVRYDKASVSHLQRGKWFVRPSYLLPLDTPVQIDFNESEFLSMFG